MCYEIIQNLQRVSINRRHNFPFFKNQFYKIEFGNIKENTRF